MHSGGAVGAGAPVDDFYLVDHVAVVVRGGQAGSVADGAVDIDDAAAGPAHEVVVVVPNPGLVVGGRTGRLNASNQPRLGERVQYVVDRLPGDRG